MEKLEEYQIVEQNSKQLKVLFYLNQLNQHWKRYDHLERGPTSLSKEECEEEKRVACICYQYAEVQLAALGYHYSRLKYDRDTLTYSLPD